MAVWLVRILDGREPSGVGTVRLDDIAADSRWTAHIERFAELRVTRGCAAEPRALYCPDDTVTRGGMAAFEFR